MCCRKLSSYERSYQDEESVSDGQRSSSLHPIAEEVSEIHVKKRTSLGEFNKRVREAVKEQEEKIKSMMASKKNVVGKRLSLDSIRAATGSVKKKVVRKQMSLDTLAPRGGLFESTPTPRSNPRKILNKKLSFEVSGAGEASFRTSGGFASREYSSKRAPRKRLSFESFGGSFKRGANKAMGPFPRAF